MVDTDKLDPAHSIYYPVNPEVIISRKKEKQYSVRAQLKDDPNLARISHYADSFRLRKGSLNNPINTSTLPLQNIQK